MTEPATAAPPCAQCGGTDHLSCNRTTCAHVWFTMTTQRLRDEVCGKCGIPKWLWGVPK